MLWGTVPSCCLELTSVPSEAASPYMPKSVRKYLDCPMCGKKLFLVTRAGQSRNNTLVIKMSPCKPIRHGNVFQHQLGLFFPSLSWFHPIPLAEPRRKSTRGWRAGCVVSVWPREWGLSGCARGQGPTCCRNPPLPTSMLPFRIYNVCFILRFSFRHVIHYRF